MLTRFILALCLCGAIGSVAIMLPGEYLRIKAPTDGLIIPIVAGPYAVMAFLAWKARNERRAIEALLILVLLMVAVGMYGLGADSAGYRATLAAHGPKIKDLYQRSAVFVIPRGTMADHISCWSSHRPSIVLPKNMNRR